MARPVKTGLDYFPFDTRQSTALQLLEAQCGAEGFGIYVHLLMQIYGDHGYYLPWSDDMALVMAYSSSTEPERIQQVVDVCVARRIFDPELYADALAKRFPRADVAGELVRMLNWLNHNPARRRKAARMPAFIESWIADAALSRPVDPAEPETDDAKRREGLIDALADADTKALWDMIPDEDKA